MAQSRISRIEERKTRKQFMLATAGIVVLMILLLTVAVPVVVRISTFLGNLKSGQTTIEGDKTAPFPPTLAPLTSSTNSAQLKVEGFAEPESTLKLFVNGEEVKKELIEIDGDFSFDDIVLDEGINSIYATATDKANNESGTSKQFTVSFKKKAPKLLVAEPEDGKTYGKNDQEIWVKGITDKGVDVRVNERFVSVRADGVFEYKIKLADGENMISVIATDTAGNQTKVERKVTYTP